MFRCASTCLVTEGFFWSYLIEYIIISDIINLQVEITEFSICIYYDFNVLKELSGTASALLHM